MRGYNAITALSALPADNQIPWIKIKKPLYKDTSWPARNDRPYLQCDLADGCLESRCHGADDGFRAIASQTSQYPASDFSWSRARTLHPDWENAARFIVSSFRMDAARAGGSETIASLVAELCATNPEFTAMLHDGTIHTFKHGARAFHHPVHARQTFEISTFVAGERAHLHLIVSGEVQRALVSK
ncbi:MAG: hypothetical protein ABF452_03135 [Gluconobacter potus]